MKTLTYSTHSYIYFEAFVFKYLLLIIVLVPCLSIVHIWLWKVMFIWPKMGIYFTFIIFEVLRFEFGSEHIGCARCSSTSILLKFDMFLGWNISTFTGLQIPFSYPSLGLLLRILYNDQFCANPKTKIPKYRDQAID